MREIKFRAWDDVKKIMCPVWKISFKGWDWPDVGIIEIEIEGNDGTYCVPNDKNLNTDTIILMQYTGLKDKNGKEIYEGDVLRITDRDTDDFGPDEIFICEVCFGGGEYPSSFTLKNSKFYKGFSILDSGFNRDKEVIGNIYDNPELLK